MNEKHRNFFYANTYVAMGMTVIAVSIAALGMAIELVRMVLF